MKRPVVGVIGNAFRIEDRFTVQTVGENNLRAVAEIADALPMMFAGSPETTEIGALLDVVDELRRRARRPCSRARTPRR